MASGRKDPGWVHAGTCRDEADVVPEIVPLRCEGHLPDRGSRSPARSLELGHLVRDHLWVHFIDNTNALDQFVRGIWWENSVNKTAHANFAPLGLPFRHSWSELRWIFCQWLRALSSSYEWPQ